MRHMTNYSLGILGSPDSTDLWQEITSHIPDETLLKPNLRILIVACGHGTEADILVHRMKALGKTNQEIRDSIYLIDKYQTFTNVIKEKGYTNTITRDFLEWETDMKFDVVIGNPPYQRAENKAKRWTLWEEFLNKSLNMGNIVAMVVPQSVTSPGKSWKSIRKYCKVINLDAKKYFNVSSTFCYFVVDQNSENTQTKLIDSKNIYTRDVRNLPCLPVKIDNNSLDLLDNLPSTPLRIWKRGELHTSNNDIFDKSGKYEVMHTNAQTLYTNYEHKNKNKIRVAVTLSGYPTFTVLQNKYCSQAVLWTEFDNVSDAVKFANECNSEKIQTIVKTFKWSGWNSKEIISLL